MKRIFVAIALLFSFSFSYAQTGTDRVLTENSAGTAGAAYTLDQIKTFTNTGLGSGTVTNLTGVAANGFTWSIATPTTTPAITLGVSTVGLLKGTGIALTAAVAGTDYALPNANTTGTAGNVTGTVAVANGGTGTTTLTGLVKGNGIGAMTAAVAGTDYALPNANTTGTAANVTGVVAIANGGTGSATQNFVDLSTTQTGIGGFKVFTNAVSFSGITTIGGQLNLSPSATSTAATLAIVGNQTIIPINNTATTTVTVAAGISGNPEFKLPLKSTSTGSVVVQSGGAETFNGSATYTLAANSQGTRLVLNKISSTEYLVSLSW
jgi:hypothetical protein